MTSGTTNRKASPLPRFTTTGEESRTKATSPTVPTVINSQLTISATATSLSATSSSTSGAINHNPPKLPPSTPKRDQRRAEIISSTISSSDEDLEILVLPRPPPTTDDESLMAPSEVVSSMDEDIGPRDRSMLMDVSSDASMSNLNIPLIDDDKELSSEGMLILKDLTDA